jgi:hypothetical protein
LIVLIQLVYITLRLQEGRINSYLDYVEWPALERGSDLKDLAVGTAQCRLVDQELLQLYTKDFTELYKQLYSRRRMDELIIKGSTSIDYLTA